MINKKKIGAILKKLGIKHLFIKILLFSYRLNSNFVNKTRSLYKPILIKFRTRNGNLAIDIRNKNGIGSKLTWVLLLLNYCDKKNLQLYIRFSHPNVNLDYFNAFFDLKRTAKNKKLQYTVIHNLLEVSRTAGDDNNISIQQAINIVQENIHVRPWVIDKVNNYVTQYFDGGKILGLHYRGTDKQGEAETIDFQKVCKNILYYTEHYGMPDKLFVSTDSELFLQNIKSLEQPFQVIYRENEIRSYNDNAIHLNINSSDQLLLINEEALINCLILSRCNFLLKSSSFLSDWSKLFHPTLKYTILNKPFDWALWFPGRVLIENNEFDPL